MKIGYLHLGNPQGGLHRYGRLLSQELAKRADVEVIDVAVPPGGSLRSERDLLVKAARQLSTTDLIHFQFNPRIWNIGPRRIGNLAAFLREARTRLAVTLHDVSSAPIEGTFPKSSWYRLRYPGSVALATVLRQVDLAIVCSREESRRLGWHELDGSTRIVIPHFIEHRDSTVDSTTARRELKLQDARIVTLLGFIHPRKGHAVVIEALSHLEDEIMVVFAGGPSEGHQPFVDQLLARAVELGVRHRVRITGYLAESELNKYLAVTDVAVCPFRSMSASGSFSTWISAGKPVLAHNLPQFREYNELVPGAVTLFDGLDGKSLAQALDEALANHTSTRTQPTEQLGQRLSISRIADEHLAAFEKVANNQFAHSCSS